MRSLLAFLVRALVGGLALWVASVVVPGITFGASARWTDELTTVLLVALVFGVVNALVKPLLRFVGAPLVWLSLGLFGIVLNAWMLLLTSWAAQQLGLAFRVTGFWWAAVLGALVVTVVSIVLGALLPDPPKHR